MTIANELFKLQTNLANAYTAVKAKNGIMPIDQNFDNLATAISSIPEGQEPIYHNGTYHIIVVDHDGTVLKEDYLDIGEVFTMP